MSSSLRTRNHLRLESKRAERATFRRLTVLFYSVGLLIAAMTPPVSAQPSLSTAARPAQQRVVKIYGAGGLGGLETYQSGFLVSPAGHVATAWSYVLDVDPIVVLDDGRRFEAEIVGFEPTLELAVLKIDGRDLPFFEIAAGDPEKDSTPTAQWGEAVMAVSNLFNIAGGAEPASVMQGRVSARAKLDARRGTFQTPYRGEVILVDLVANNPGAAGGALINASGQLVGMLGKELRDRKTGVWLNYAIPAEVLRKPIGDIIAGRRTVVPDESDPVLAIDKAHSLETLGLGMIPDVLETTPAYVDFVQPKSPAAKAGVRPDDLLLLIGGRRVPHQRGLRDQLRRIDRRDDVAIVLQRDNDILSLVLRP